MVNRHLTARQIGATANKIVMLLSIVHLEQVSDLLKPGPQLPLNLMLFFMQKANLCVHAVKCYL